jgi:hypothetical protein
MTTPQTKPPLKSDGTTIAIGKASATSSGYLSKQDFILFSGDAAVAVNSFNTRTGEIVLLSDDILAALGYVPSAPLGYAPLNKAGDTMGGPLRLAGPPANSLDAVTKAYAESLAGLGGALPPATWRLATFNASGSKQTFTGTIAGTAPTTLTLSAASDFAVGQGILIKGAGSNAGIPGALVTKVDAIDATNKIITLHDAASGAVSAVTNNVQHDETAAVQAGIDYVIGQNGGTLLADAGRFRLNGALNDIGSLLKFPHRDIQTTLNVSVCIRGTVPLPSPGFFGGAADYGTIFQTDVQATSGAMLRAANFVPGGPSAAGWNYINNVTVFLENLTWRTYENPQISGIDLGMAKDIFLRQVVIDAAAPYSTAAAPTATGVFGLRTPRDTASATGHTLDTVWVQNYYTGIIFAEQMVCIKAFAMRCMVGVRFDFSFHQVVAHFVACNCRTAVLFADRCVVNLCVDIQNTTNDPAPALNLYRDFDDSGDQASGFITYVAVNTESHTQVPAIKTGLSRALIVDMGGTEPPQIPTSLAPLQTPAPLVPPFGRYREKN